MAVPSAGTGPVAYAWGLERKSWPAVGFAAVVVVVAAAGAVVGRHNCMLRVA